jgi:hypothetical protein
MAEFTRHTRMPLERAIEVVENALEHRVVLRQDLREAVESDAPEAASLLDHTIQVMIHGGYVRRVHLGPNLLAYEKTERWPSRDEMLLLLRAPRHKHRFRPRCKGKRIYPDAPTVEAAKAAMRALPVQKSRVDSVA